MNTQQSFTALTAKIIAYAKQIGASHAEVEISAASGFQVTVLHHQAEAIEHDKAHQCDITVMRGQQSGSASTTDFSWKTLQQTVDAAFRIATFTQPDPFLSMPDEAELAHHYPDLQLYHPYPLGVDVAIKLAMECESLALAQQPRGGRLQSDGATVSAYDNHYVLANSLGFVGERQSSSYSVGCTMIAKNDQEMQRDYAYTRHRKWQNLQPIDQVAALAVDRVTARLGSRQLQTGKMPVVLSYRCSKLLIGSLLSAITGSTIYKKSSFLLDKVNEHIFPAFMQIEEKPFIVEGLGSAAFDAEGVRTREKAIIDQGVLTTYLLSTYSANQLKQQTTGNAGGVYNLLVQPTTDSLEALLSTMGTGLLVTETMGSGINIVDGTLSLGVSGFYVEGGECVYPVSEVTIAGNLADIYQAIVAIADDPDENSSVSVGSILIEEMMVAGQK